MAKKIVTPKLPDCKDCRHSYDWHEKGANGQPFLCRCKYQKFCRFLTGHGCNNFSPR